MDPPQIVSQREKQVKERQTLLEEAREKERWKLEQKQEEMRALLAHQKSSMNKQLNDVIFEEPSFL